MGELLVGLALAVSLALSSTALAQSKVWVVDDDAGIGVDFSDIRDAIGAASAGDMVLVRDGVYAAFTVAAKSVSIIGDLIRIESSAGVVRLEDVELEFIVNLPFIYNLGQIQALRVENSDNVVLSRCTIVRLNGAPRGQGFEFGSIAIRAEPSNVYRFDSDVVAGSMEVSGTIGQPGIPFNNVSGTVNEHVADAVFFRTQPIVRSDQLSTFEITIVPTRRSSS